MDKHRWLGELELRCNFITGKNKNKEFDHGFMEDRDRLIMFAYRLVEKRLVSRFEMLNLIEKVDQRLFGTE